MLNKKDIYANIFPLNKWVKACSSFQNHSVSSYCFEFCHNTCTIVIGEQPWRTTTGHEVILLSLVNNKYLITNHTQIPRNLSINLTKWHPNEKKSSFRTSWSNMSRLKPSSACTNQSLPQPRDNQRSASHQKGGWTKCKSVLVTAICKIFRI